MRGDFPRQYQSGRERSNERAKLTIPGRCRSCSTSYACRASHQSRRAVACRRSRRSCPTQPRHVGSPLSAVHSRRRTTQRSRRACRSRGCARRPDGPEGVSTVCEAMAAKIRQRRRSPRAQLWRDVLRRFDGPAVVQIAPAPESGGFGRRKRSGLAVEPPPSLRARPSPPSELWRGWLQRERGRRQPARPEGPRISTSAPPMSYDGAMAFVSRQSNGSSPGTKPRASPDTGNP